MTISEWLLLNLTEKYSNEFVPEPSDWGFNEGGFTPLSGGQLSYVSGSFLNTFLAAPVETNKPFLITFKPDQGLYVRLGVWTSSNTVGSTVVLDNKYLAFRTGKALETIYETQDMYIYNNGQTNTKIAVGGEGNRQEFDEVDSLIYVKRDRNGFFTTGIIKHLQDQREKLVYIHNSEPFALQDAIYLSFSTYNNCGMIRNIKLYT